MDNNLEFDKQTKTLIEKGYATKAGMSARAFLELLLPLQQTLKSLSLPEVDLEKGYLPFVIVIKSNIVPTETAMSLVEKNGKEGVTKLTPHEANDFKTIESVQLPESVAYIALDIDRGKETINLPPNEAKELIEQKGRSPLTIDEGVAIITQFPEFLIKNNCYSLLASRKKNSKSVPAIWINANKNPNLGWCWDGNPHTWLGSASCKNRIGIPK